MTVRHPNARRADDGFFIGWQAAMPAGHRRVSIIAALALMLGAVAVMASIRVGLSTQEAGIFEFGSLREVTGTFMVEPVPMLLLDETIDGREAAILVGSFKFGVPEGLRTHHGKRVQFAGTAIRHEAGLMIELTDETSFTVLAEAPQRELAQHTVGQVSLTGELVDTKCFFGVMRPGFGKVHRACAARCLSGGVPPGLLIRDAQGLATVVMLRDGDIDPQWAARTIRVEGDLTINDGVPVVTVGNLELLPEDK